MFDEALDYTIAAIYCLAGGIFLQGEIEALIGLLFKMEGFADGPMKIFVNSCIGLAILATMVLRAIKVYKEIYPKKEKDNGITNPKSGREGSETK